MPTFPQLEIIDKLIYISSGNIPSQMAHSMQIVKMAEAFSEKVANFELITSGDISSFLTKKPLNLKNWYGLHHEFQLTRVPLHLYPKYPFPKDYYGGIAFYGLAALYTLIKSPSLAYTRTPAVVRLLLKMKVPVMWELHELPQKANLFNPRILSDPNLIGLATTSPKIGEFVVSKGLPSNKLIIEPNAVDLQKFLPYQSKEVARKGVDLPTDVSIVVYTGHLYDYKGIPTILELAALMPSCMFVLVGGWEKDINRVRDLCESRKLANVKLIGHVSQTQLPNYLYAADVLILPTSAHWEQSEITSPLKLFDYMASRRPVVASALPNIQAVTRDRENALLVEPDNAQAFKTAIQFLLEDQTFSAVIAEQAFEDIQQHTWEKRADRILDFIETRLCQRFKS